MKRSEKPGFLMTANWDSGVGYAWWLMESYWEILATAFDGHYRSFLAYPSISKIPDRITDSPVTVIEKDFSAFGLRVLSQIIFIVKNRIRVIYFSDKPTRHWAYILFRLAGVRKIVIHDHTPGLRTPPRGIRRLLKKAILLTPGLKADVCIGATEFVRKRLIDVALIPQDQCFAVPNGVSTKLPPKESVHQRFGIPKSRKVIVTAARANRYKGGFFALDVFAELMKNGDHDWHYVYMGDGPDRAALIQRSRDLGIDEYVSFPGRVEGVVSLCQSCFCAFHPSMGEVGYSLSILEYMLCGLPVVVPDNPSVCGATKSNIDGAIYAEGDVNAAKTVIGDLLESPERVGGMGEMARREVLKSYSLEGAHHTLLQVFKETVEENVGPSVP